MLGVFFFQAEDGIRDYKVTGVQTCALPISPGRRGPGRSGRRGRRRPGRRGRPAAGGGNRRAGVQIGKAASGEREEDSVGAVLFKKKNSSLEIHYKLSSSTVPKPLQLHLLTT